MKQCNECGCMKPYNQYSKDKTKNDGLQTKCKQCKHHYYIQNKEHYIDYQREFQSIHNYKLGSGIYGYYNLITKQYDYIGASKILKYRQYQHNKKYNNHRYEIIEHCSTEDLFKREAYWIKHYNPVYNIKHNPHYIEVRRQRV